MLQKTCNEQMFLIYLAEIFFFRCRILVTAMTSIKIKSNWIKNNNFDLILTTGGPDEKISPQI